MSIVICELCDKRIDSDYDEFRDLDDQKRICNDCLEEMEEDDE